MARGKDIFDLAWEEPSPQVRGRPQAESPWVQRLRPLMENPGRWARVAERDAPLIGNVSTQVKGAIKHLGGRWEHTTRRNSGRGRFYVRYLGPEEPEL